MEKQKNKNKKSDNVSAVATTSAGTAGGADNSIEEKSSENAPITITVPVPQQSATNASLPQNAPIPFCSGNHGRGRGRYFGNGGRQVTALDPGIAIPKIPASLMLIVWMLPL